MNDMFDKSGNKIVGWANDVGPVRIGPDGAVWPADTDDETRDAVCRMVNTPAMTRHSMSVTGHSDDLKADTYLTVNLIKSVVETTPNEVANPSKRIFRRVQFDVTMMMSSVAVSGNSTCTRLAVGCVLTANKVVVSTGHNGAPTGMQHCIDSGCLMYDGHCIQCAHAEANAVTKAKENIDRAYVTDRPCLTCLKLMVQKGAQKVIYWRHYESVETDLWVERNYLTRGLPSPLLRVGRDLSDRLRKLDSDMRRGNVNAFG